MPETSFKGRWYHDDEGKWVFVCEDCNISVTGNSWQEGFSEMSDHAYESHGIEGSNMHIQ